MKFNRAKWIIPAVTAELVLYFVSGKTYVATCILLTLCIILLSFFGCLFSTSQIEVELSGGSQSAMKATNILKLKIKNKGKLPCFNGSIKLNMNNSFSEETLNCICTFFVMPGKEKDIEICMSSEHCGCISIKAEKLYLYDTLKIFRKEVDVSVEQLHFVLPKRREMSINEDDICVYDMESHRFSESLKGDDISETFDIREYQPGDKLKSIHWKLTAKNRELMVKEASLPIDNSVLVIIDKCMAGSSEEKDDLFSIYAAVSKGLLEKGIAHNVGWYDSDDKTFIIKENKSNAQFWENLRSGLKASFDTGRSSVERLFVSENECVWAVYIYISNDDRDVERLREYGNVNIYKTKDA